MNKKEKYNLISWEYGLDINTHQNRDGVKSKKTKDKKLIDFNVVIETDDYSHIGITIVYDLFIEFLQNDSENFKNYIQKHKFLDNLDELFNDFEEIGIDIGFYLQKYIDEHVNEEVIEAVLEDVDELDWE